MTNELNNKIKNYAVDYWNEFLTTDIDAEWTQTAYEDLGELKSETEWAGFHSAVEYQVKEIESEVEPVEVSENINNGSTNFFDESV